MFQPRVIPCLLVQNGALVKTVQFENPAYVGDPANSLRIFNDKEVDELVLLDISATPTNTEPNLTLITQLASECFMPLAYGGGIRCLEMAARIMRAGVEKLIINTSAPLRDDSVRRLSSFRSMFARQIRATKFLPAVAKDRPGCNRLSLLS
jgi:imidazole glycerol-phosphate synthase subunit HisF